MSDYFELRKESTNSQLREEAELSLSEQGFIIKTKLCEGAELVFINFKTFL